MENGPFSPTISITFTGQDVPDLKTKIAAWLERDTVPPPVGPNGHDDEDAPAPTITLPSTRRRRGREATSADPPPPDTDDEPKLLSRDEIIEKLQKVYLSGPEGAEKVIALQVKMNVKRFKDLPDDKFPELADQADRIWAEINNTPPPPAATAETGPF